MLVRIVSTAVSSPWRKPLTRNVSEALLLLCDGHEPLFPRWHRGEVSPGQFQTTSRQISLKRLPSVFKDCPGNEAMTAFVAEGPGSTHSVILWVMSITQMTRGGWKTPSNQSKKQLWIMPFLKRNISTEWQISAGYPMPCVRQNALSVVSKITLKGPAN